VNLKNKIFVNVLLAAALAMPAQARMVESAESTHQTTASDSRPTSMWKQTVTRAERTVNRWLATLTEKAQTLRQATSQPTRQLASESTSAMKPTDVPPVPTESQVTPTVVVADTTPIPAQTAEEQKELKELILQTREAVSGKEAITVAEPGRPGTSVLPTTKVGVPTFALTKTETKKGKDGKVQKKITQVKEIPKLDIGIEKTISKNDFVPSELKVGFKEPRKPTELATPKTYSAKELAALKARPIPAVAKAQPPKRGQFSLGQIVTMKKIEGVSLEMVPTKTLEALRPVKEMNRDDLKMVAAIILFDKGDKCHMASGLLTELSDIKSHAEEANFLLGVCAHQMGFHSEAVTRLLEVIKSENKHYLKDAIANIVEDLPRQYDVRVATALKAVKTANVVEPKVQDNYNFVLARAAHAQNRYAEAATHATKVSDKSARYADAQYLLSIALYGNKKLKDAEQVLLGLRKWMATKNQTDKNIQALIAINLARMRFTQGRYQSAHEEYLSVPKDHPVWVQALIEQGWSQLNTDDPAGAIGNMYSLHSPYFKSVFMPESWVVRTIGYIDICQFGDAYRTLTRMEQLHSGWLKAVNQYSTTKKSPDEYYNTVRNYIRGRSDADVDGLPHQVIREIARQRGFLNVQNVLNNYEDEIAQYGFIYSMVRKEQTQVASRMAQAKTRLAKIRANIAKIPKNPDLIKFTNEWNAQRRNEESLVKAYEFQTQIYEESRKGFVKMRTISLARLEREKARGRNVAGQQLIAHLKDIRQRIGQLIEGNEFLRYEIFSGSGENIRYQVAGGATSDARRIPANVKPQKILNWEFDGEYWEDEIGSYRSTLKNNCPNSSTRTAERLNQEEKATAKN